MKSYRTYEVLPDLDPDVPGAVKQEMLKLIMIEREEVSRRMVKLDYWIWVLEEYFRKGEG